MTIFWILVAGLAGLALLFVLAPLLSSTAEAHQDDDVDLDQVNLGLFKQQLAELDADLSAGKLDRNQYDSARQDLEREVLNDLDTNNAQQRSGFSLPSTGLTALALVVAVPASTLALYLALGSQDMIPPMGAAGQVAAAQSHNGAADGMPSLDVLVIQLEERLQQTPDDAEGWIMLGRTYFAMQDAEKAETALARAYALMPKDSQVLLAYAEALAANNDNSLEGQPSALIAEALELDPDDVTARWLSGMAAFQRGQFTAAAVAWKRVLSAIDPESEDAAELRRLIDNTEQRAGVPSAARLAEKDGAGEVGPAGDARASSGNEQ
ncbi:MAG: c-type cytochrome biogenesis protein CcmI, partial [Thiohalocapsa sp.]